MNGKILCALITFAIVCIIMVILGQVVAQPDAEYTEFEVLTREEAAESKYLDHGYGKYHFGFKNVDYYEIYEEGSSVVAFESNAGQFYLWTCDEGVEVQFNAETREGTWSDNELSGTFKMIGGESAMDRLTDAEFKDYNDDLKQAARKALFNPKILCDVLAIISGASSLCFLGGIVRQWWQSKQKQLLLEQQQAEQQANQERKERELREKKERAENLLLKAEQNVVDAEQKLALMIDVVPEKIHIDEQQIALQFDIGQATKELNNAQGRVELLKNQISKLQLEIRHSGRRLAVLERMIDLSL